MTIDINRIMDELYDVLDEWSEDIYNIRSDEEYFDEIKEIFRQYGLKLVERCAA